MQRNENKILHQDLAKTESLIQVPSPIIVNAALEWLKLAF